MDLLPYPARLHPLPEGVRPFEASDASPYARKTVEAIAAGATEPTFASWTLQLGERGLALFNGRPSRQWWVRTYDLMPLLATWGLRALPGLVACGKGSPSQTVPVARLIDAPEVAPMMAEAIARLAKQRAIAERWLLAHPRAAAIGLVPDALRTRGKARGYARQALRRLLESGCGEEVAAVVGAYGAREALAELWEDLAPAPAPPRLDSDSRARELEASLLRANAGNEAYGRVDALAALDSERALFALVEVAHRARSRPIRRRARESLEAVRVRRGLSAADLEERMLPTLGLGEPLDAQGSWRLSASSDLKAALVDREGRRRSRLPRGLSAEAKARWKLLRRELKTVARSVLGRLEQRMIAEERWSAADFRGTVLAHPLLRELARGLVFDAGARFRVAEDYTLADVDDEPFALPEADVAIVHPLHLSAEERAAWVAVLADNACVQPFPQLSRPVARPRLEAGALVGLAPALPLSTTAFAVLGATRRGWERGRIERGALLCSVRRELAGCAAEAELTPGIALHDPAAAPVQRLGPVRVEGEPSALVLSELGVELAALAQP